MGRAGRPDRSRPASTSPLLPRVEPVAVPTRDTAPEGPAAPVSGPAPAAPALRPRPAAPTESGSAELPKYLTLERKDARLRRDQVEDLTALARRLSGRRQQRGERITDNTLIRVAVDLLLQHAEDLRGDTEDELRDSVTSVVPESASSGQDATA